MEDKSHSAGPLAGIRVLDISRVLAGPFCAAILADLGAEVIKIETPWGDDSRAFGPFWKGHSAYYRLFNRSKQGITLNLKDPGDVDKLRELSKRADVLVENFRPGVMERLGVAPQLLRELNPRLIITSISGFGQEGEYSSLPAYDLVAQALSGLMSVTGPVGGEPTRVGISLGDVVPGLYAALGTVSAVLERERSGRGQHVDLAMYDSLVSILESVAMRALHTGENPVSVGNDHALTVPFSTYHVGDGEIVITVSNERLFAKFARAIGLEYMLEDPRYSTNAARVARREEVRGLIEKALEGETVDSALEKLSGAGIACSRIATVTDALTGDLGRARGVVAEEADGFKTLASPLRLRGMVAPAPAPDLGEHNDKLADWLAEPPRTGREQDSGS